MLILEAFDSAELSGEVGGRGKENVSGHKYYLSAMVTASYKGKRENSKLTVEINVFLKLFHNADAFKNLHLEGKRNQSCPHPNKTTSTPGHFLPPSCLPH
jgi:hypothetical protein